MALLTTEALVLRTYDLGRDEQDRGVAHARARQGAGGGQGRAGGQAPLPLGPRALSEVASASTAARGPSSCAWATAISCARLRAGARGLETSLFLSYAAELLDGFAPEGEAEEKVYRLALATVRAAEAGAPVPALSRYLEAWLLRLHGLYPPLDRCAGCSRALAPGGRRYHRASHGFVCDDCGPASGPMIPEGACSFLGDVFRRAPTELGGPLPAEAGVLEPFHHDLISRHLERVLRSRARAPRRGPGGRPVTLQEIVFALERFWSDRGCLVHQPWDAEVGAGTMHPETFFRVLGPKPWKVAYVQPSRRPADGRYGENPNRLYKHEQLQVILKPPPSDIQDLYLKSLLALGIDPAAHDVRFEEDNWESPTLGAWGIGWQVLLDGQEITQFTYFQQAGGIDLAPISGEITYGLERIGMYLQDVDDVYALRWSADTLYGEVRKEEEYQLSRYSFELADADLHRRLFDSYLAEGWRVLKTPGGRSMLAAYDWCLKSSHAFNVLDARGAISVTERAGMILSIRKLACAIAALCTPVTPPEAEVALAVGSGGV